MGREEKIVKIKQYYYERGINFLISYLTSIMGGFVVGVVISIATGQRVLEVYQKVIGASMWGLFFVGLVFIYGFILWLLMISLPRRRELNTINGTIKRYKFRFSIWEWILIISSIFLEGLLLYNKQFDFAFKFLVSAFLIIWFIHVSRKELSKADTDKIERKIELCKLRISKFQNISTSLISVGAGFVASGIAVEAGNYNLTWIGMLMIIIGTMIENYQVTPRYYLLEEHLEKIERNKIK